MVRAIPRRMVLDQVGSRGNNIVSLIIFVISVDIREEYEEKIIENWITHNCDIAIHNIDDNGTLQFQAAERWEISFK